MTRAPLPIVFQNRASSDVEAVGAWWRVNRTSAPDMFEVELKRVLQAVALLPDLGAPARDTRLDGVRRVLLPRTRHYLYYRHTANSIQVLAVWHTSRGQAPGV